MSRTHPAMAKLTDRPVGLHAEIHACLGIPMADLEGSSIFVYRVLKNGKPALAKPCHLCQKFLLNVGIKSVTFTTASGYDELSL